MDSRRFTTIAMLVLFAIAFAATPSRAAPFVDIRAMWSVDVDPWAPAPGGIGISCYGEAVGGPSGCSATQGLHQILTSSGTVTASSSGGLVITNTTTHIVDGFLSLRTNFSAFNPGGPAIGIGIDDPLTQAASFMSTIGGQGVGDGHSCAIGFLGQSGTVFSPTTCGVGSPDSSQGSFGVDLSSLAPNEQLFLPYGISISATFVLADPAPPPGVPAPASLLVLFAGLAGLGWCRVRARGQTRALS